MAKYFRKEYSDLNHGVIILTLCLNEVFWDNDDDKDDGDDDDDDGNSKDAVVAKIGTGEALDMFVNQKDLSKEERNSCCLERQIREDKKAEQKSKPHQWLFYVRINFVR